MQNSTPEERGCQAPVGTNGTPEDWSRQTQTTNKPIPPLYDKIKQGSGLTTSDLNAIIAEVGGKPLVTPIAKVIEACNQPNETPAKAKSIEESRKLLDTFSDKLKNYPKVLPRRQPVANRNAYEIRADVLQMAIDWTSKTDEYRQKKDDDVINLAKKFYEFVEDRRRR